MHGVPRLEDGDDHKVEGVVRRIRVALGGVVDERVIEAEVRASFAEWGDAPVRDFIPLLAERRVLELLRP